MTTENVIETHQLTITFQQIEDGSVNWIMDANEEVKFLYESSLWDLAAADCSLALMGIRALAEQCGGLFIQSALERASLAQWQVLNGRELAFQLPGASASHAEAVKLN